jgi:hypothetical protein
MRAHAGPSNVVNCRLLCAFHDQLAARTALGHEWVDRRIARARTRTS